MLISVITPTYNSEKTIARNINSVIQQNYNNFEHIIIDNLSEDKTIEIASKIYHDNKIPSKLRIISEKDNGISDAFNKGIKAAKGEVISILNSDDLYFNEDVFKLVNSAFDEKDVLFVHGNLYFVDEKFGSNIRKPLLCRIEKGMPFNHPTMFIKKEPFEKWGLFDLSLKYAMDYEIIVRFEKNIKGFRQFGKFIDGPPLAIQYAGGVSWKNEVESINEVREILKKHDLWNKSAKTTYLLRKSRTILKKYLSEFGLDYPVKMWRKRKWRN